MCIYKKGLISLLVSHPQQAYPSSELSVRLGTTLTALGGERRDLNSP